jgi:homocysteine S-methyltransferase
VKDVHSRFIKAGADIIETNTFGATRFKLMPFGLEEQVAEINKRGVEIAREVAGNSVIVAGAMGPVGKPLKTISQTAPEKLFETYLEQASALNAAGVDIFIIETISDLDEMTAAVKAIQKVSDKPIICQCTFNDSYQTIYGDTPEDAVKSAMSMNVDVVGLNCTVGPSDSLEILKRMRAMTDLPISVQPNAGAPRLIEGRYIYLSTPEYMAEYAKRFIQNGASFVGGCCGTTPEHTRAMKNAIKALKPKELQFYTTQSVVVETKPEEKEIKPVRTVEKSPFARKLHEGFAVSVEINPPRGFSIEKILGNVELLRAKGIDVVNIPDGPRASMRMSPIALAAMLENRTKMETMLHYTCRDRNILGMQSDLMGAHTLGLRNFLIITGDPPKLGDYPDATAVFDVDAIGLVKILNKFNHGRDVVGNPVGKPASFHIGVGANPGAINREDELRKLKEKVEAGAEFILTQPVYDARLLEAFLQEAGIKDIPVVVGILPLVSSRMAEFLTNEVPGMSVPEKVREKLQQAAMPEQQKEIGIEVAREALKDSRGISAVRGVYIMLPSGSINSALQVLEV